MSFATSTVRRLTQRADDTEEVFEERMRAYEALTAPVVEHYRALGRFARGEWRGQPVMRRLTAEQSHGSAGSCVLEELAVPNGDHDEVAAGDREDAPRGPGGSRGAGAWCGSHVKPGATDSGSREGGRSEDRTNWARSRRSRDITDFPACCAPRSITKWCTAFRRRSGC